MIHTLIYLYIHSFYICFLNDYYLSGTISGAYKSLMTKKERYLLSRNSHSLGWSYAINIINKQIKVWNKVINSTQQK